MKKRDFLVKISKRTTSLESLYPFVEFELGYLEICSLLDLSLHLQQHGATPFS